jgi:NADPH:quinone reductase-like Zn-dependent oxidoreductase
MRAVLMTKVGGPDVLELADLPSPNSRKTMTSACK